MHALVDPRAPVTAALIEAIGVPAVLLDPQGVIQALSPTAPALVAALARGKPLALVMRDPDLIDAIEQVSRHGGRRAVELIERVPVERTFRIHIAALAGSGWRRAVLLTFEDLSEQRMTERINSEPADGLPPARPSERVIRSRIGRAISAPSLPACGNRCGRGCCPFSASLPCS